MEATAFYANDVKVCQFKAKDSEIKPYSLRLGNISKEFIVDDMTKRVNWIRLD